MSTTDLHWLPAAPDNFRALCRSLTADDAEKIRALATHALNVNQLENLARALKRVTGDDKILGDFTPLKLALLGNGTTSLLGPALLSSGVRHGLSLDIVEAPFDQAMQSALDPNSDVIRAKPDIALLAFDHRLLQFPDDPSDAEAADNCVEAACEQIDAVRQGIRTHTDATVIMQTIPAPASRLLGSFDLHLPGSPGSLVRAFNRLLCDRIAGTGDVLLDVEAIATTVGLERWHDAAHWNIAKLPFAPDVLPLYSEHVTRLIGALKGKSRKCLVLDLDNTLWGGVIGDDGLAGIALGQGDPVGEAHLDVQQTALQLRRLGVVLAVCSKNTDETARLPFREHPDMVLRESDIAVFQANWSDKASNLTAIANALDIGVDALVLLDDNPAEREQVRQALPAVAVPELPEDAALFGRTLLAAGYFETVNLTREDLLRANDYTARAKRVELQGQTADLGAFLSSLDMEISFAPFDEAGRVRISQLINKSNQFNLTTRRYSENDVAAMQSDPATPTLQVRLRDRFGDNGMISVVICREEGGDWKIDTWLMSCRVLGRRVEEAVLAELSQMAAAAGARSLIGEYIPSERNQLVRDHYEKLGFEAGEKDGTWLWDVGQPVPNDIPMKIVRAE